jgi:anaphase-promoting complex subunit 1
MFWYNLIVNGYPKISYLTDNTQHIVFTSIEPSLVFTYDTMIGVHSIWRVRKARTDVGKYNVLCGVM